MTDAAAVSCSILLAWGLFDLAAAVRRVASRPLVLNLTQDRPLMVHNGGTVEHRYRLDEPREPWQGGEDPA